MFCAGSTWDVKAAEQQDLAEEFRERQRVAAEKALGDVGSWMTLPRSSRYSAPQLTLPRSFESACMVQQTR